MWPKYWSFCISISPSNEYSGWFPLGLTGLISLLSKGFSRVFSSTTVWNINSLALSLLYCPTLTSIHDYWGKKKNYSLYKNTVAQTSLATFEDHRKSIIVSGTEGGEEKRKGKLDLLAMICMRGMLRVLDLIFQPNRRPWKLWKGNNMAISIVERERKKRLVSGTQIRNWWHASNKRISWQR